MSPTKKPSRPRKVSAREKNKASSFRQRKIPKPLNGVPFCYYGAKMEHFISGDATIQPPVSVGVSESVLPLHVTAPTPQDTLALYLASGSCLPPSNSVHSQIPVSERCLDNATRVTVNRGADSEPSGSYMPLAIPFHYDTDFNSQSADNIFSMTNNPYQSYGRYENNDQSCDSIPSSSIGSLSMEYCDERYQEWLESLDPNTHSIIPHSQAILPNHDASTTFSGNSYNDIMLYAEITGTAPSSFYSTMTSANNGTASHFPDHDANDPHNYYM